MPTPRLSVPAAAAALLLWTASAAPAAAGFEDGVWTRLLIAARAGHTAIHDPVRDRMIVFGGDGGAGLLLDDLWALTLGDSTWSEIHPVGDPPTPRRDHTAIYDPVRDRMVVFGGSDGSDLDDVWALSLSDTPTWTRLSPAGAPPPSRHGHSAIYDPVRDRMVVFGGLGPGPLQDVWALSLGDPSAWSELAPTGAAPVPRYRHSAIYDPVADRMVVFGGIGGGYLNDVYALALADPPAWSPLEPGGTLPAARSDHCAIYDPVRGRMLVFGGNTTGFPSGLGDVRALSLGGSPVWKTIVTSGQSARREHDAIYDPVRDRMVVFGGRGTSVSNLTQALPLSPGTVWSAVDAFGTPPGPRTGHMAVLDPVRHRMLVFGGSPPDASNDVHALALDGSPRWTLLAPGGARPAARGEGSLVHDPVRDRLLLFGGRDAISGLRNDLWALSLADPPAWTELAPAGGPPAPREGHTAIYDPARDHMIVFGGNGELQRYDDVWVLAFEPTPTWTRLDPAPSYIWGRPDPVDDHTAVLDPLRDRMVVFGGTTGLAPNWWPIPTEQLLTLALGDPSQWLEPDLYPWIYRTGHSAIRDPSRDRIVVFGGSESPQGAPLGDAWELPLGLDTGWTALSPGGPRPRPRKAHSAVHDPIQDRMILFGGVSDVPGVLEDLWALGWQAAVSVEHPAAPATPTALQPLAPNPSAGRTRVTFSLARAGHVELGVFDVRGRRVRTLVDGPCRAGVRTSEWDGAAETGARAGDGIYFVRLVGPGIRETRKLVLVR